MSGKTKARGPVGRMIAQFRTGPQRRLRIWNAARKRARSEACFIAVTGSSGKSTTVGLLAHILQEHATTRRQMLDNTVNRLIQTLKSHSTEDAFVVAELGVGRKGDMAPMAQMLQPDVAIVTMVGTEHYSAFRGSAAVAEEKGALLESLQPYGLALLNADDPMVMSMVPRSRAKIITFGKDCLDADYRVEKVHAAFPEMLSFTLLYQGQRLEIKTRFPGMQFWMPVAAATAAAIELGVPTQLIEKQVSSFLPVEGRCSVLSVPDGPRFILDTTKAPEGTLDLAFDMLARATIPRKRLILGVISDYPGSASPKYRKAWLRARDLVDQVIFVGKDISLAKPNADDIAQGRIIGFATPQEAFDYVKATARPDELILIKGSANLHLARIALGFVQPVRCWEPACGMGGDCFNCPGLMRPFNRKAMKMSRKIDRLMFWKSGRDGRIAP